jgi:hypothetical protein
MVRILLAWLVECGRFRECLGNNPAKMKATNREDGLSLRSWRNVLQRQSKGVASIEATEVIASVKKKFKQINNGKTQPLTDFSNNDTSRNWESIWLVQCRPTPKYNFSTGKNPALTQIIWTWSITIYYFPLCNFSFSGFSKFTQGFSQYTGVSFLNIVQSVYSNFFCVIVFL